MKVSLIQFCGRPAAVACDGNCGKAFGLNNRPRLWLSEDVDDVVFLADNEVGDAPDDPGTYEGDNGKPTMSATPAHNKWCIRECERSTMVMHGDARRTRDVRDWSKRLYNCQRSTRKEPIDWHPYRRDPWWWGNPRREWAGRVLAGGAER